MVGEAEAGEGDEEFAVDVGLFEEGEGFELAATEGLGVVRERGRGRRLT